MKKTLGLFIILFTLSNKCKSQDTIVKLWYDKFSADETLFTKAYEKQNAVYVFALNENELHGVRLDINTDNHDDISETFDADTRGIRNFFFTDTSFVVLLKSRAKKNNTYKYEYSFNQLAAIKTNLNLPAFDETDILGYSVVNSDMVFWGTDKKDTKLVFNRIDKDLKTHNASFSIDELVAMTGLKKGFFKDEFMSKETAISFDGDKDLIGIGKSRKCYFIGDTVYLISGNIGKNVTGIFKFDIANKKAIYNTIKRDETVCKKDKKDFLYYSTGYYNKMLITSKACSHTIDIFFNDISNGVLLKTYSIDSENANYLKHFVAKEIEFKKNKTYNVSNISDEILDRLYSQNFYVSCTSIDTSNFVIATGVYSLKGNTALAIIGSVAELAVGFYDFSVFANTLNGIGSYSFAPMYFGRLFISKQLLYNTRFIAAGLNKSSLVETPDVIKNLDESDTKITLKKKQNIICFPLMYKEKKANLFYNKDEEMLSIVKTP